MGDPKSVLSLVQQLHLEYNICLIRVIARVLVAPCDSSHMFMMIPPAADLTGLLPFTSLLILRTKQHSCRL